MAGSMDVTAPHAGPAGRAAQNFITGASCAASRPASSRSRTAPPPSASNFVLQGYDEKRGVWPRAFLLRHTYLSIGPAYRLIVVTRGPVLEILDGSRSDQHCQPARRTRRDRRSLAAAWPVLRPLCDLGDVSAYARSLMLR